MIIISSTSAIGKVKVGRNPLGLWCPKKDVQRPISGTTHVPSTKLWQAYHEELVWRERGGLMVNSSEYGPGK